MVDVTDMNWGNGRRRAVMIVGDKTKNKIIGPMTTMIHENDYTGKIGRFLTFLVQLQLGLDVFRGEGDADLNASSDSTSDDALQANGATTSCSRRSIVIHPGSFEGILAHLAAAAAVAGWLDDLQCTVQRIT